MIILNQPYKLVRKVIFEKTSIDIYRDSKTEKIITKKMKIKYISSFIISLITSVIFSYATMSFISLTLSIMHWETIQRFIFLIFSLGGTVLVFLYCGFHAVEYGYVFEIKIKALSENWFKKLFSIFIFYFIIFLIISSIISFCAMSIDITKLDTAERTGIGILFYAGTIIVCSLAHNNNLPFILKIEEQ